MREATGPMSHATPVGAAVAGRYELVGVNGSLLPVSLEADEPGPVGCSVVAGELRLQGDGRYILELTARYDTPAGAGGIRRGSADFRPDPEQRRGGGSIPRSPAAGAGAASRRAGTLGVHSPVRPLSSGPEGE